MLRRGNQTGVLIVASLAMLAPVACSRDKQSEPDMLAQDSTFNRGMQTEPPQLSDTSRADSLAPALVGTRTVPVASPATRSGTATERRPRRMEVQNPAPRTLDRPQRTPGTALPSNSATPTNAPGSVAQNNPGSHVDSSASRAASRAASVVASAGSIPTGSLLDVSSDSRVCTGSSHVGDYVTGTVTQTVAGSNGAAIPAGAKATFQVTQLQRSNNANQKIVMGFALSSIEFGGRTYPVSGIIRSAQVRRVRNEPASKDAQKVAEGAIVGAILGEAVGHDVKGAVAGGAIGAAAGAGVAAGTANYDGCVPVGGKITAALTSPVQVTM